MKLKGSAKIVGFALLAGLLIYAWLQNEAGNYSHDPYPVSQQSENPEDDLSNDFDRNPASIYYSKHARCRMECRQIDESEVREILENGEINQKKSELEKGECKRRFAVEGISSDRQRLRIIFAPCKDKITVVTCIDLEQEWACSCD